MTGGVTSPFGAGLAATLRELAPVLRRAVKLDEASVARVRVDAATAAVLVRLPFDVLVARTVAVAATGEPLDVTVGAGELMRWLDGERTEPPRLRDADWRGALPPSSTRWRRVDTVPDPVVRDLVRTGALALKEGARRAGTPGAHPRTQLADALLDSVVLTAISDDGTVRVDVTLRWLSALTRMGFLARDSHLALDVAGRWIRLAAAYGSVYAERPGLGLDLLRR